MFVSDKHVYFIILLQLLIFSIWLVAPGPGPRRIKNLLKWEFKKFYLLNIKLLQTVNNSQLLVS